MRLLNENDLTEGYVPSVDDHKKNENNSFRIKLAGIVTVIIGVLFAIVISMIIFK